MKLDKDTILDKTDRGLDVFRHYMGAGWPGLNKAFKNPFYEDSKASCHIYLDKKSNVYRFMDFGDTDYNLDCFALVAMLNRLDCTTSQDFIKVMEIINQELALFLESPGKPVQSDQHKVTNVADAAQRQTQPTKQESPAKVLIPPVVKEFSTSEINFWRQYGIDLPDLRAYNVVSLKQFRGISNKGNEYCVDSTDAEPMFGYMARRYVKVYRPKSKRRFLYGGDLGGNYCFGLKQLPLRGDILFITGGEKDVLTLAAAGLHAICFNSETVIIPRKLIRRLSFRFKHIIVMYDTDQTGIKAMEKHVRDLAEFDVKKLLLPLNGTKDQKDVSDYFRQGNTSEELMKLFGQMLDSIYQETMSLIGSFEVCYGRPPQVPPPVIAINDVPIGSPGNIMAITGPEGSGKSNYLGGILAGTIVDEIAEIDCLGTDIATNPLGKAVLFYDTEQSEEQLYRNLHQVVRRSEVDKPPSWLKVYGLVGMSRKDRMLSILQSMDRLYYQFGGIHLVIIDGIADLIDGVNDEERAVRLIDELFRLAGIYKTCIVCVLHLSPGGYKLRGHLGSEVQRKAAGILSVEKEEGGNYSVIKALKVRAGSPLNVPEIVIGWDDDKKLHVFVESKTTQSHFDRKLRGLSDVARDVFKKANQLSYSHIVEEISERLNIKGRQARYHLKFMKENGIIHTVDGKNGQYVLGLSSPD